MTDVDELLRAAAMDVRLNVRAGDALRRLDKKPRRLAAVLVTAGVLIVALVPMAFLMRPGSAPVAEPASSSVASSMPDTVPVPDTVPAPDSMPAPDTTFRDGPSPSGPIPILDVSCGAEPVADHVCDNLIDGDPSTEYQFELPASGEVVIEVKFAEQVSVNEIVWANIDDSARFADNLAVDLFAVMDDSEVAYPVSLEHRPGRQVVPFVSLPTFEVNISIFAAHVGSGSYDDVAIAELEIWGTPAP